MTERSQQLTEDQDRLPAGYVVNNRYKVLGPIGKGGMGIVYICEHLDLDSKLVAMKVLYSEVAEDELAVTRFRDEVMALYRISDPHVIRAYEYINNGDIIAYTMEYVDGQDLADLLESSNLPDIPTTLRLLTGICRGVRAIHRADVIHRDLKPENILLTKQGIPKVGDFGVACWTNHSESDSDEILGTLDYISPEYLRTGRFDRRSDIYAIGVIGFELITGRRPFSGEGLLDTIMARLRRSPVQPHLVRQDCPEQLSAIITRALATEPEARYQTVDEMLASIEVLNTPFKSAEGASRSPTIRNVKPVRGRLTAIERPDSPPRVSALSTPPQTVESEVKQMEVHLDNPSMWGKRTYVIMVLVTILILSLIVRSLKD